MRPEIQRIRCDKSARRIACPATDALNIGVDPLPQAACFGFEKSRYSGRRRFQRRTDLPILCPQWLEVDSKIANHRQVAQRLEFNLAFTQVPDERSTGPAVLAVDD